MTPAAAVARLRARGLSESDAATVVEHLEAAERMGRTSHGLSRIPWLEELLEKDLDPAGRPRRVEHTESFERWHGGGALGHVTLAAVCIAVVARSAAADMISPQ